jgi:hypothetical protein
MRNASPHATLAAIGLKVSSFNKGEQETGKSLNGKYGPERIPFQKNNV